MINNEAGKIRFLLDLLGLDEQYRYSRKNIITMSKAMIIFDKQNDITEIRSFRDRQKVVDIFQFDYNGSIIDQHSYNSNKDKYIIHNKSKTKDQKEKNQELPKELGLWI